VEVEVAAVVKCKKAKVWFLFCTPKYPVIVEVVTVMKSEFEKGLSFENHFHVYLVFCMMNIWFLKGFYTYAYIRFDKII